MSLTHWKNHKPFLQKNCKIPSAEQRKKSPKKAFAQWGLFMLFAKQFSTSLPVASDCLIFFQWNFQNQFGRVLLNHPEFKVKIQSGLFLFLRRIFALHPDHFLQQSLWKPAEKQMPKTAQKDKLESVICAVFCTAGRRDDAKENCKKELA